MIVECKNLRDHCMKTYGLDAQNSCHLVILSVILGNDVISSRVFKSLFSWKKATRTQYALKWLAQNQHTPVDRILKIIVDRVVPLETRPAVLKLAHLVMDSYQSLSSPSDDHLLANILGAMDLEEHEDKISEHFQSQSLTESSGKNIFSNFLVIMINK